MLLLKLGLVIVGLMLPGFLLARVLRVEHAWVSAFPLSALLLVETVLLFSFTAIPIQLVGTVVALAGWSLLCLLLRHKKQADITIGFDSASEGFGFSSLLPRIAFGFAVVLLLIVALRASFFPLRGPDTAFRWEGLALAMLQNRSLDFYPPVTAADYAIYLYADGIPPLVATVYWWLYAGIGLPMPQITAVSVGLQLAAILALTFHAAHYAFGRRAAWYALLVVGASPLLLYGVAIGQETGFTALSVAGQLCYAWAAVRQPRRSAVIMAALFAALGALSRDYGPALSLAGIAVILWHRETRRFLPLFIVTVILLSAPWYLRSWVLTGNPFFSHRIPGGFSVNVVHAAIFDYYREIYAFATITGEGWLKLVKHLVTGAFLALCVGIPCALLRWRDTGPLLITVAVVVCLWVVSVGQTAGGVVYSTRVLAPAVVAMAIVVGAMFADAGKGGGGSRWWQYGGGLLLLLLCGYALVSVAGYPARSNYLFTAPTGASGGSVQQRVLDHLEATGLPPTGVLTDMTFFAESMKRTSRFRPVMHWSPEVAFLFGEDLDTPEMRRRLREKNINLILVDYKSPNNGFLSRYKFFRDSATWKLVFKIPNEFAVYHLN